MTIVETPKVLEKTYAGMPLRVVMIDGALWFVAMDVCKALNTKVEKGTSRHTQYLNDDEKRKFDRQSTPGLFEGTRGGHSFAATS